MDHTKPTAPKTVVLETGVRLSKSLLWHLLGAWYDEAGTDAWGQGLIPQQVTSNPFIAAAYAEVFVAYVRDAVALSQTGRGPPLDLSAPFYILEMGGGSGRFTFHFLRKLAAIREISPSLPAIRYVFTDFAEKNIEALRAHPQLQSFIESGALDFARYKAGTDTTLTLLRSGETLIPGGVRNPLIVVANYVFDGLPMDVFFLEGERLKEGLATVSSKDPEADPSRPAVIEKLELKFSRRAITLPYFGDPVQDGILEAYRKSLSSTPIVFPTASLNALGHLADLSSGRLLLLTADKGYDTEEGILDRGEPILTLHGSFSLAVNYNAMRRWFQAKGGQARFSSQQGGSLDIGALLLDSAPASFEGTWGAFSRAIHELSPNDFHLLKNSLDEHFGKMTIEQLLALVRLSGYDPQLFRGVISAIRDRLADASSQLRLDILAAARRVDESYFFIGESFDLSFELGRLCYALHFDDEAIEFYKTSMRRYGPARSTYYNMALCHQRKQRFVEAFANVNRALEMDATYALARELRVSLEDSIHASEPR